MIRVRWLKSNQFFRVIQDLMVDQIYSHPSQTDPHCGDCGSDQVEKAGAGAAAAPVDTTKAMSLKVPASSVTPVTFGDFGDLKQALNSVTPPPPPEVAKTSPPPPLSKSAPPAAAQAPPLTWSEVSKINCPRKPGTKRKRFAVCSKRSARVSFVLHWYLLFKNVNH